MRSFRVLGLIFFLLPACVFADAVNDVPTLNANIQQQMPHPLMNKVIKQTDPKENNSVEASFPQFTGYSLSMQEKKANTSLALFVHNEIASFVNEDKKNQQEVIHSAMPPANKSQPSSSFKIQGEIIENSPTLLSVRFSEFTAFYYAAHPNTNFKSLNFDLKTGAQLSLADLFKPGSDYLKVLSDTVRPMLMKKLYPALHNANAASFDLQMIDAGTTPTASNFQVWNLAQGNLMLTFPAYQVAAYVYGTQTVMVPLQQLEPILSEKGIALKK